MDDLTHRMQSAYNQIAHIYADVNASMPDFLAGQMNQFLAQVDPGTCVLDLACGAGRDLNYLMNKKVRAFGADLSWEMLRHTRLQTQAPLLQTNMLQLGFESEVFGGVWCSAAMLHLPKNLIGQALLEVQRVLKTDGRFYVVVQGGEGEGWESGAYDASVERFFARYDAGEFADILTQNGFRISSTGVNDGGKRQWLHFLCQRGGKC